MGDTGSGAGGKEGALVEVVATASKLVVSGAEADRHCSSLDLWFCIRCTTPLSHSLNSVMMLVSYIVPRNTILTLLGSVSHRFGDVPHWPHPIPLHHYSRIFGPCSHCPASSPPLTRAGASVLTQ